MEMEYEDLPIFLFVFGLILGPTFVRVDLQHHVSEVSVHR